MPRLRKAEQQRRPRKVASHQAHDDGFWRNGTDARCEALAVALNPIYTAASAEAAAHALQAFETRALGVQ